MRKIENTQVTGSNPVNECKIADSGVLPLAKPFNVEKESNVQ